MSIVEFNVRGLNINALGELSNMTGYTAHICDQSGRILVVEGSKESAGNIESRVRDFCDKYAIDVLAAKPVEHILPRP